MIVRELDRLEEVNEDDNDEEEGTGDNTTLQKSIHIPSYLATQASENSTSNGGASVNAGADAEVNTSL